MPNFTYTARDGGGLLATGVLVGETAQEVARMLRGEGKYPVSIRLASEAAGDSAETPRVGGIRIPRSEVIQISTQLSIMVETGVTLSEALDCIGQQAQKPNVKKLVDDLGRQVQSGVDFSSALERHPRSFPRLFVALIKASERSGMMGKLLTRAAAYLRDEQEIIRRVRGALTYPAIMFTFAVTTTIFLLAFVLPRFTAIYAQKKAALPAPTKILMAMSNFIVHHYIALPLGAILVIVAAWTWLKTPAGRRFWHTVQLRVPLLGPLFRDVNLARSLRMLGTMAAAGVNLMDCVQTAGQLTPNSHFADLWANCSKKLEAGRQLSDPLFDSPLVPKSIAQMIHSGEKSGKLSFVLEQIAQHAEVELKERIAQLTRYVEPIMIVVMGAIIGGVSMALLLPIFTISRVVAN
jgi:type IV pilus assembly protein PilC